MSKTVSLHPSEVHKPFNKENIYAYSVKTSLCEENSDKDENTECVSLENMKKRKKPATTKLAVKIVHDTNTSTKKTAKLCKVITWEGCNIPSPTQAGIYKGVIWKSNEMKEEIKND